MSEDVERAGLGKVVYSVEEKTEEAPKEKQVDNAEVEEADQESFPASDPPGFSGAKVTEETKTGEG